MWRAGSRSSFALVTALVLLGATSCTSAPQTLRWSIELATPALLARTESVVARVLVGGCSGTTAVYDERIRSTDTMTLAPPLLAPGRYGLEAFALDDACALVAADCREVMLPTGGEVTLVLNDAPDAPTCPRDVCTAAGCSAIDAGARDAGAGEDAGQTDAGDGGARDGGADAGPRDAGPGDAGLTDAGRRDGGMRDGGTDSGPRDGGTDAAVCTTTAPRVTGSFTSSPWFSRVDATGGTIRFSTSGGAMGSLTLTGGVTATGSIVASELCTMTCTPLSFRGVTAADHTLTFRDWRDVESRITLVGATATGGLELTGSDGYLVSVTASGSMITFANGATPPITGTIVLTPETTCE